MSTSKVLLLPLKQKKNRYRTVCGTGQSAVIASETKKKIDIEQSTAWEKVLLLPLKQKQKYDIEQSAGRDKVLLLPLKQNNFRKGTVCQTGQSAVIASETK